MGGGKEHSRGNLMEFVAHNLSFILREDAHSADNAHRCLPTDSLRQAQKQRKYGNIYSYFQSRSNK